MSGWCCGRVVAAYARDLGFNCLHGWGNLIIFKISSVLYSWQKKKKKKEKKNIGKNVLASTVNNEMFVFHCVRQKDRVSTAIANDNDIQYGDIVTEDVRQF